MANAIKDEMNAPCSARFHLQNELQLVNYKTIKIFHFSQATPATRSSFPSLASMSNERNYHCEERKGEKAARNS